MSGPGLGAGSEPWGHWWVMTEPALKQWMKRGIPDDWTVAEAFVRVDGQLHSNLVEYRFEIGASRPNVPEERQYWFKLRGPNFTFVAERDMDLQEIEAWIHDGDIVIAEARIPVRVAGLRPADTIHFQLESE